MSPLVLAGSIGLVGFLVTALVTPLVRRAAISGGLVRGVQADRWHSQATPAVGGIGIFVGFGSAVAVAYALDPATARDMAVRPEQAVLPLTPWSGLVAASGVAFVVGLVDDLLQLRPLPKLVGQVAAASILLLSGIGVWLTGWYPADAVITMFWFVGITNALNLLDNMDGLAAGTAGIAGLYLALIFYLHGAFGLGVLALGFSAALLGFLVHNYPPAKIFMGDSGSLFLGLFLAGLALAPAAGLSRSLASVLAAPVLILGVPILDTTLVTIGRMLEGRPVSQGGRDHTSHRFVSLGLSEKRTVWLLWALAAAGGAVGVMLRSAERGTALLLGGIVVGVLTLVGGYLLTVRLRELDTSDAGAGMSPYRFLLETHRRYPVFSFALDAVWIVLAYYGAYLIRWDPAELPAELPYLQRTLVMYAGIKLVAFVLAGVYAAYLPAFGLYDAVRVVRANVLATLLAVVTLFALDRVGLSRGVVAIDFLLCTGLTLGARFSFRLLEGTTRRWGVTGKAVVVVGSEGDVELAVRHLDRIDEPRLRPVAVVTPRARPGQSVLVGLPCFGGDHAISRALEVTGAQGVVLTGGGGGQKECPEDPLPPGVFSYRFEVSLRPEGGD